MEEGKRLELMISGIKLHKILQEIDVRDQLDKVLSQAASVIIYRASPKQKAEVVNFIKQRNKDKMTLAIGDGANDVNMIQSAHIGIGIKGKEGNQAAMFSDYAIPEFKALRRLILWQGRNFGQRIGDFTCHTIFKNMCISCALSIYNIWGGYSGLQQVEQIYWMMFNSNLTLISITFNFIFDQDLPFTKAARDPDQHEFRELAVIRSKAEGIEMSDEQVQVVDIYDQEKR